MRKLVLIALFGLIAAFSNQSFAQETRELYCEVIGRATFSFKGKIKIEVDFGQENGVFEGFNKDVLKDPATGKIKKFNSMIDALNFMANDGWVLVNAFNVSSGDSNASGGGMSNEYHYILKKVVNKE